MFCLWYLAFCEATFTFWKIKKNIEKIYIILNVWILLRSRIEKTSLLSGILQCRQRISEAVPNPYTTFYDYLQSMAEQNGIKKICVASIWQTQPFSTTFPMLTKKDSDLLQVLFTSHRQSIILYFIYPSTIYILSFSFLICYSYPQKQKGFVIFTSFFTKFTCLFVFFCVPKIPLKCEFPLSLLRKNLFTTSWFFHFSCVF